MTLQELLAKKQELAAKIQEFAKAHFDQKVGKWDSAESEENWGKLNNDYDETKAKVDAMADENRASEVLARLELLNGDGASAQHYSQRSQLPAASGINPALGSPRAQAMARLSAHGLQTHEQQMNTALAAWIRGDSGSMLSELEYDACAAFGINPHGPQIVMQIPLGNDDNVNALYRRWGAMHESLRDKQAFLDMPYYNAPLTTGGGAGEGGNIIPPETMLRRIEVNMLAFGGMRAFSELMTTASGEPMSWPTADDTGNTGRYIPENTPADDNAGGGTSGDGGPNPSFAKVLWGAYKATSDTILIPFELIQDNVLGVGLLNILGDMLGERIGRLTNNKYTVGTGTGEPTGIVTAAELGVTAAGGAAITWQETIALEHSVDPAYRNGAQYMCHDSTVLHLRQLSDNQDRPIWQSGIQAGTPDTLNGRSIQVNQDMPTIALSAKSLLFGPPLRYKIRRAGTFRLYRLEERYREKDQTGMVAFLREDGNLLNSGTNPVKFLQQAAA